MKLRYILGGALCLVALPLLYLATPLRPWLDLKILEHQVKSNLDPTELQQWAVKLIAQHSGEITHWDHYYGKDLSDASGLPSGLKTVGSFSHGMNILAGDQPPSVGIFGDTKGGPGLIVGSPSLTAPYSENPDSIMWKPGIYFLRGY